MNKQETDWHCVNCGQYGLVGLDCLCISCSTKRSSDNANQLIRYKDAIDWLSKAKIVAYNGCFRSSINGVYNIRSTEMALIICIAIAELYISGLVLNKQSIVNLMDWSGGAALELVEYQLDVLLKYKLLNNLNGVLSLNIGSAK